MPLLKKTVSDIDVADKRVLVRLDLDVSGTEDDVVRGTRIRSGLPTVQYLRDRGARVILCSHQGDPEGRIVEDLRLDPVRDTLEELLGTRVLKAEDCIGPEAQQAVGSLESGDVLLLENTQFHYGESTNYPGFARELASLAEVYVNDAFSVTHRADASTQGVARYLPAVAGLTLARELEALSELLRAPDRPFVTILGGTALTDKVGAIERLLGVADQVLLGGELATAFLRARGLGTGASEPSGSEVEVASRLLAEGGARLALPLDVVVGRSIDGDLARQSVPVDEVPPEWRVMDIGPRTEGLFRAHLKHARTVVWYGPLGVVEVAPFAGGTLEVAQALADLDARSFVAGTKTVDVLERAGLTDRFTHVSRGGVAFLNLLSGSELPAVSVLEDR